MQKHYYLGVLLICLLFTLGACISGKQRLLDSEAELLVGAELKILFSSPLVGTLYNYKGITSEITISPDGSQTLTNSNISDTGTWRIKDDTFCSKWKFIKQGIEKCFFWSKIEDNKYEIYGSDGSKSSVLTVK